MNRGDAMTMFVLGLMFLGFVLVMSSGVWREVWWLR